MARALRVRVNAELVLRQGYPRELAEAARSEARTLVADHPETAEFRYALARAELACGDREAALMHLRAAARSMPFLRRDIQALERPAP